MPHGLTLGPDGDVWIVDAGLHQVIRYDAETGERVAAYGAKLEPGEAPTDFACPPTSPSPRITPSGSPTVLRVENRAIRRLGRVRRRVE